MLVYESKTLQNVLDKLTLEFNSKEIELSIQRASKSCLNHGSFINLHDLINETPFFQKCIVKEYQTLIKKVYECRWSLDISQLEIIEGKCYIIVKTLL